MGICCAARDGEREGEGGDAGEREGEMREAGRERHAGEEEDNFSQYEVGELGIVERTALAR
jgi:hypothetical protein